MTTEYVSVEDLLSGDELNEEDVTLPNGKKVRVKGLSSYERQLTLKNAVKGEGQVDTALIERRMIKLGLVQPRLNEDQVEAWMKSASIGSVQAVTTKIRELSGMGEGAEKS
jgi:hypothetical protein